MDTDLVVRAQRGDKGAFALVAAGIADRFLAVRAGSCATSTSPRTRRSRRCSPSGRTFRSSATRPASRPGRTGSSCTPATPRAGRSAAGRPTSGCCRTMSRGGGPELGRRSRPARARLPAAVHRSSHGGGAPPLPRPAARRGRRGSSASRSGRPTHDFTTRCAGCARRSTPTRARPRGRQRNERRTRRQPHRPVVAAPTSTSPRTASSGRPSRLDTTPQRRSWWPARRLPSHEQPDPDRTRGRRRWRCDPRLQPAADGPDIRGPDASPTTQPTSTLPHGRRRGSGHHGTPNGRPHAVQAHRIVISPDLHLDVTAPRTPGIDGGR